MKQRDKKILFVAEDGTTTARPLYRAINPANGLKAYGWDARVCPVLYEQEDHTFNGWSPGEESPAETPKIIVAHNFMTPDKEGNLVWDSQQAIVETARIHGQKFYFDLDDDVWNIPDYNPASSSSGPLVQNYDSWISDVNSSNGLIVSTDSIRQSAQESGDVKVPIYVVRNSINYQDYSQDHTRHSPFRIGWIGDILYRGDDFDEIIPFLYSALQDKRGEIEFWHIGAHYEIGFPSIRDRLANFPVDIIERPWISPQDFPKAIEQIDLCLIPSKENKFNHGRSNALGLACISGGIPFIASPTREYAHFDLAISNKLRVEWQYEIIRLYENPAYYREVVEFEHDMLLNWNTPKRRAEEYIKIFEEACQN